MEKLEQKGRGRTPLKLLREVREVDRKLSFATTIADLMVSLIGLLDIVLGVMAVINGIFPGVEGSFTTPPVSTGSIILGAITALAGVLWFASGVGQAFGKSLSKRVLGTSVPRHVFLNEWASRLALYVSPVIIAVNLVGVTRPWGFSINTGWAIIGMVVGVFSIWYFSRKKLATFFIIAVAEHAFVLAAIAMLIYSEPMEGMKVEEKVMKAIPVTIEELKLKEQKPPLAKEPSQEKKAITKKKKAALAEELPVIPKIKIQSVTDIGPGTKVEHAAPKMPQTFAQIVNTGATDSVLRAPGPDKREQRGPSMTPSPYVESSAKSSEKPTSFVVVPPSQLGKGKSGKAGAGEPKYARSGIPPSSERSGRLTGVARPGFVGSIMGEIEGRRVVSWPRLEEEHKGTEGGSVNLEILVDPTGDVVKVKITKKSGNPRLDRIAMEYVKQIRFEELPDNVQQRVQRGEILINFELAERAG